MDHLDTGIDSPRTRTYEPAQIAIIDSPDTRWQLFEHGLYSAADKHEIPLMVSAYLDDSVTTACFCISSPECAHMVIARMAGSQISLLPNSGYPSFHWSNETIYSDPKLMIPIDAVIAWLKEAIVERLDRPGEPK